MVKLDLRITKSRRGFLRVISTLFGGESVTFSHGRAKSRDAEANGDGEAEGRGERVFLIFIPSRILHLDLDLSLQRCMRA